MSVPASAPVVIFAFNRPQHLRFTLGSLERCIGAGETNVVVFADGPRNEDDLKDTSAVREVLEEARVQSKFKSFVVHYASENKGLAPSVIAGVSKVISEYGSVVVLEDDVVPNEHFIAAMNKGLRGLEDDSRVWALSGYSPPVSKPRQVASDCYLSARGSSWGWATWRSRWDLVNWNDDYYRVMNEDWRFQLKFAGGGGDLPIMLHEYLKGNSSSWAIRWFASQCENGMKTVYPYTSIVKNVGLDGTGTHSPRSEKYDVSIAANEPDFTDFDGSGSLWFRWNFARFHMNPVIAAGWFAKRLSRQGVSRVVRSFVRR